MREFRKRSLTEAQIIIRAIVILAVVGVIIYFLYSPKQKAHLTFQKEEHHLKLKT